MINIFSARTKKAVFDCFYIIPSACIHLLLLIPNLKNGSGGAERALWLPICISHSTAGF